MTLLVHLLLNSGSAECTSSDFFLRLFRNYVYCHFIYPKINKRGGWNESGGLENFSKIYKRGGTIIRYLRVGAKKISNLLRSKYQLIKANT